MLHLHKTCYTCLKCKKDAESASSKVLKTKNGRTILSSKCVLHVVVKNQNLLKNKKQRIIKYFRLT